MDIGEYPASVSFTARIGNGGATVAAAGLPVAFYSGDPDAGGTLLGTRTTSGALAPGDYEDVAITWNTPGLGLQTVFVVADDDGRGGHGQRVRRGEQHPPVVGATFSGEVRFVGSALWAFAGSGEAIAELDVTNNLNQTATQCRVGAAPAPDLTLSRLMGEPVAPTVIASEAKQSSPSQREIASLRQASGQALQKSYYPDLPPEVNTLKEMDGKHRRGVHVLRAGPPVRREAGAGGRPGAGVRRGRGGV
ncbi:MAG: hypothetical protein ACE5LU_01545 [Anaerolineae bacterium]